MGMVIARAHTHVRYESQDSWVLPPVLPLCLPRASRPSGWGKTVPMRFIFVLRLDSRAWCCARSAMNGRSVFVKRSRIAVIRKSYTMSNSLYTIFLSLGHGKPLWFPQQVRAANLGQGLCLPFCPSGRKKKANPSGPHSSMTPDISRLPSPPFVSGDKSSSADLGGGGLFTKGRVIRVLAVSWQEENGFDFPFTSWYCVALASIELVKFL